MYVLIVIMVKSGMAISMQDFNTLETCTNAAYVVRSTSDYLFKKVECVKK